MERVLITGGAGFIGSNFCNINKENFKVIALDNLFLGDPSNLDPDIEFIEGDCSNLETLEAIEPVDHVVHLAGTSSAPMFMGNGLVDGYVNSVKCFVTTLEWARKNGTKKFLYASTSSLYGNNPLPLVETQNVTPINHYAVTKDLYENCSRAYNKVYPEMDIIGFRFMSVYGRNEEAKGKFANLISQFCWDIARDLEPVIYGDGSQTRDFTNVRDVVQGLTKAIQHEEKLGATVFNIGTGNATTVKEIADTLIKAFEKDMQPKYIENPVKEDYVNGQYADISKIKDTLGYEPTVTLEAGLKDQVANLRIEKIRETSSDDFR